MNPITDQINELVMVQAHDQIHSHIDNDSRHQVINRLKSAIFTKLDNQVWGPILYQMNWDIWRLEKMYLEEQDFSS